MMIKGLFEDKYPKVNILLHISLISLPQIFSSSGIFPHACGFGGFLSCAIEHESKRRYFSANCVIERDLHIENCSFGITCLFFFPCFFLSILSLWANRPTQMKGFLVSLCRFEIQILTSGQFF